MPEYNFNSFLSDETYRNLGSLVDRKREENKSLPFFKKNLNINNYYTDFAGNPQDVKALETTYLPYKAFTDYVVSTLKGNDSAKISLVNKYLNWLDANAGSGTKGLLNVNRFFNEDGTRKEGISDADFNKMLSLYTSRRNDGNFGYYHLGPQSGSNSTVPQIVPTGTKPQPQNLQGELENQELPFLYSPLKPLPVPKSKYPGWSDWMPITMNTILDGINISRQNWLDQFKQYPLEEAPYHLAKVTNGYATRQLLELNKLELRALANQNLSSDINLNLKKFNAVEDRVGQLTDKQVAIKAGEFADTTKHVTDTANWNNDLGTLTSNRNRQVLAAAFNDKILSAKEALEKGTATMKNFISDMYTNYGEYLKTKRLNLNARKANQAEADLYDAANLAYSEYNKLRSNPESWSGFGRMLQDVMNDPDATDYDTDAVYQKAKQLISTKGILAALLDVEVKEWLKNKLADSSTLSKVVQKHQKAYSQAINDAGTKRDLALLDARKKYNQTLSGIDLFTTNLFGPDITLQPVQSVLMDKLGAKLDRLTAFIREEAKERLNVRKHLENRHAQVSSDLNKQLDRLTDESLLLLRSVFKR